MIIFLNIRLSISVFDVEKERRRGRIEKKTREELWRSQGKRNDVRWCLVESTREKNKVSVCKRAKCY